MPNKSIPPTQVRRQPIKISDAEMRCALRFAFSQLCGAYPDGLFTWLKTKFPKIHQEITESAPQAINTAWAGGARAEFTGAIQKFLDVASVAIAAHSLKGRR